ncbi:hypothetical protein F4677DRAFT_441124 [Hypoxylon crocopeplum]|nr:hypothetical protein F4677DRAFT_441124 [Hypoxylon crocopeplum]
MAPQKPRCTFKECKSAAQRIVGDCGFCEGHFCAKHRLLEDHKCSGLEDVSMNPTPLASSGSDDDEDTTQWWLVGLAEYLLQEGVARAQCGPARGGADASHPGCIRSALDQLDHHHDARLPSAGILGRNPDFDGIMAASSLLLHPISLRHLLIT